MDKRFFDRVVRLDAGRAGETGKSWTDLRFTFEAVKTSSREPDTLALTVYNLNEDSRGMLQQPDMIVRLFAGYRGQGAKPPQIFFGDVRAGTVKHVKEGPDWITTLEAADGGTIYSTARLSRSWDGPILTSDLLRGIAEAMGLDFSGLPDGALDLEYQGGFSIMGPARQALDDVARSAGVRWAIQDGELAVWTAGGSTGETAVLLSSSTGLVGTVERMDDGRIAARCLLNGRIKPKRRLQISSAAWSGIVKPFSVKHRGDSGWAPDYYTEIEGNE